MSDGRGEREEAGVQGELGFTVLGGTVGATADGRPMSLGGPKQRRMLAAFLAEAGVVVSADRLVEAIWPDDTAPEGARRTVMTYVSRLRAVIGAAHLVTRDGGYVLELDGAVALSGRRRPDLASLLGNEGRMVHLAFGVDHGFFDSILVAGRDVERAVADTADRFNRAAQTYQQSIAKLAGPDDLLVALKRLRAGE